jgi:putative spermidine/putrescine transport system permease protein
MSRAPAAEHGVRSHPLIVLLAIVTLLVLLAPLAVVVAISFTSTAMLSFPPQGFSLRWYTALLDNPEFARAIGSSLKLAAATAAASMLLGASAAVGLRTRSFPGRGALEAFLVSPLMLPQLVLAIALLMYFSRLGLRASFIGLWLGHVVVTTPYVIRMVLVSLARVDPNIERAARVSGAGPLRVFFQITLRLLAPGVAAGTCFAFIMSFDNLVVSLFLSGPRMKTLPVEIYGYLEYADDPLLAAVSSVVIVGIVLLLALMEKTVGFTRALVQQSA